MIFTATFFRPGPLNIKTLHDAYDVLMYDGASVNSRKKNLNLFSPPFFYQNSRKNIFKFIFSNVFPKTAEKKYLNLFSPTFFQKQEKKYI